MKKWVLSYLLFLCLSLFAGVATAFAIVSDDFSNSALNTSLWTFINPRGDATLRMTGTQASISFPARRSHDAWYTGNYEARIMQPATDSDFEVEVKFESSPIGNAAMNGIIVEQDSQNYLRFEFYSNATNTMIFAAVITPSAGTVKNDVSINATPGYAPLYMRIKRNGENWTQSYSLDGSSWTQSVTFSESLKVSAVGVSAGNAITSPAYTSLIDYFFNTSSPIEPQDGNDLAPPAIKIWYGLNQKFGQIGTPQISAGILGNISNPSRISSLTYSLNGIAKGPLSMGPNGTRLQNWGDFNANISFADLICGNNKVKITAKDNLGNTASKTVNLEYACNNYWPETYFIDWNTVTNIQDVAQVVDGLWKVKGGVLRPVRPGYDRVVAIGGIDPSWDDYVITVPVTFFSLDPTVPWGPLVGIIMRWQGHYDWDGTQPPYGWWPLGAVGGYGWIDNDYKLQIIGNNSVPIAKDNSGRHLKTRVPYIFKMRVKTKDDVSIYSLKVWEKNSPEPSGWDISGTGIAGELKYGSVMLMSHYVDADFGNVTITPVVQAVNPPVITTQPIQQTVNEGQNATFTIAASGTPPMAYKWKRNGVAIPGATSAVYTTPATTYLDNGAIFRCVVSNPAGSVLSNPATLTVIRSSEGCEHGYWKQPQNFASWPAPYHPEDLFSSVFENAFPDKTLLEVLEQGGGGLDSLGRETVAALLNAQSAEIDYNLTTAEVIRRFNGVFPGAKERYDALKSLLTGFNLQDCPLN